MNRILAILFLLILSVNSQAEEKSVALWNDEINAVAFCENTTVLNCYVISGEVIVNVSKVENSNLGKLGITPKNKYESVNTFPEKWLKSSGNELMVLFKTEAWLSGQRYSVSEPVLIKSGTYVQR